DKRFKKIIHPTICLPDHLENIWLKQRAENQGPVTIQLGRMIDPLHEPMRFCDIIQKRHIDLLPLDSVKLGQQTMSECFRRNAGTIGYIKNGTLMLGHDFFSWARCNQVSTILSGFSDKLLIP